MSSETRIFFLGLDFFFFFWRIPALFSRIPHSAAPRQWKVCDIFKKKPISGSISALFIYDVISLEICFFSWILSLWDVSGSLRWFVWRFGDVCEVFRRREEEDPVSAAAGGWGAWQSAVSADTTGQWTRPARESEESILPPLSFSAASFWCFSLVSVLAEQTVESGASCHTWMFLRVAYIACCYCIWTCCWSCQISASLKITVAQLLVFFLQSFKSENVNFVNFILKNFNRHIA